MPMVPEAAVAMLACARIGAVHSVIFGGSYLKLKNYEEAITALERCIQVKPDYSAAYQALTVALYKGGHIDRSNQIGRRGIEVSTANGDVMVTKQLEHFLGQIE